MSSLADRIEAHLRGRLAGAPGGVLEIQRSELSDIFGCAPSQISYVLETRFTAERGYLIESRRGGRGYIRIVRLACRSSREVLELLERHIGERVTQEQGTHLVRRLEEERFLTAGEAQIILAAIDRDALAVDLPLRDVLRARLLKAMLLASLRSRPPHDRRRLTLQRGKGGEGDAV